VRFVPRGRSYYRSSRRGGDWEDYPLPSRRGSRSWDRDRGPAPWDQGSRDSRYDREDPRDTRNDWVPYEPERAQRDSRSRSNGSGNDDWAPYDPDQGEGDDW
jgi:hypothetical protein